MSTCRPVGIDFTWSPWRTRRAYFSGILDKGRGSFPPTSARPNAPPRCTLDPRTRRTAPRCSKAWNSKARVRVSNREKLQSSSSREIRGTRKRSGKEFGGSGEGRMKEERERKRESGTPGSIAPTDMQKELPSYLPASLALIVVQTIA